MKLNISSVFDAGNIEVINADNPNNIQLKIEKDTHSDFLQWFYLTDTKKIYERQSKPASILDSRTLWRR